MNNIDFEFHDFKKLGISESKLKEWARHAGLEALINKRGTTWNNLDAETQNSIRNEDLAFSLMQEKTSLIKRPILENGHIVLSGFDEDEYRALID